MAQYRKDKLVNGEVYHIFTRSIAGFVIFNDRSDYLRMLSLSNLYRYSNFHPKYSDFLRLSTNHQGVIIAQLKKDGERLVDIISFCLMPTHIHFVLKQATDGGISKYLALVLNSYSRYFNTRHQRTGPLWSGRFKSVFVSDNDLLLHLIRYIHLNPTSAGLVEKPEQWEFSSYHEYLGDGTLIDNLCDYCHMDEMVPDKYKQFVDNQKNYQRLLSITKSLTIDDYSG